MPFGKYRGTPLADLPGGYLDLDEWREPFRSALGAELTRRKGEPLPGVANGSPRAPARRRASESPASTVCDVCGLGPTAQRPLVHESCHHDEVPF
jgi:hypothetical protein